MIAAVHAILGRFEAIETFEADAQALAQLPDEVGAGIVAGVVEFAKGVVSSCSQLGCEAVQVDVSIGDGGAELVTPPMSIAGGCAPVRQGFQCSVTSEGGVAVQEAGVVAHATDALAINSQHLQGIFFANVQSRAEVDAPAKNVVAYPNTILCTEITEHRAELQMAEACLLKARVEAEVRHTGQHGIVAVGVGAGVQVDE